MLEDLYVIESFEDLVTERKSAKINNLTCLEVLNLINIGIASHNFKQQVPNDIPTHGQIIPSSHLKSQIYIDKINQWTKNQETIISGEKN